MIEFNQLIDECPKLALDNSKKRETYLFELEYNVGEIIGDGGFGFVVFCTCKITGTDEGFPS